jgi:uncharacterized protein (UPF0276 family)
MSAPLAPSRPGPRPLPPLAGAGLKAQHVRRILDAPIAVDWFEVHAENYMGAGGPPHAHLAAIRARWPLSVHGVGASIGGAGRLDPDHLARLAQVVTRYEPFLVSEHLAWSSHMGTFANDLLPLPYNGETLARVCAHVDELQSALGRTVLIENPSTYVRFVDSDIDETEFLAALAARTGCGLLLDVNNVAVSATNHGFDAAAYIDRFPMRFVGEIHLAGHEEAHDADGAPIRIDTHDRPVAPQVWTLYRRALAHLGPVPTLIEWDDPVPDWETLEGEVVRARIAMAASVGGGLAAAP